MGFPVVRLTVHALDVVLSVQRRYHFIYMNFISPQRAAKQSNTLIADMLLMGGGIRQHCGSCHGTAISYVYSMRKTSSFFRMSYCVNALIFRNILSASGREDGVLIII